MFFFKNSVMIERNLLANAERYRRIKAGSRGCVVLCKMKFLQNFACGKSYFDMALFAARS